MHTALPAAAAHELPCCSNLLTVCEMLCSPLLLLVLEQRTALEPAVLAALLLLHLVLCLLQLVSNGCIRFICMQKFMSKFQEPT